MGQYRTTLAALSPTYYYYLDETSGTTVNDSSGNGNNGTFAGSITKGNASLVPLATGEGTACTTAHASEGGIILPTALQPGTSEWAFTCWFKITSTNPGFFQRVRASTGVAAEVFMSPSGLPGTIRCRNQNTTAETVDTIGTYADSNVHHLVAQRRLDGAQWVQEIYIDGVLENNKNLSGAVNINASDNDRSVFYASSVTGFTFDGTLDEVAYFKTKALTPTEIANLYAAGIAYQAIGQLGISFANSGTAKTTHQAISALSINMAVSGIVKLTPQAIGQLSINFQSTGHGYKPFIAYGQLGIAFTSSGIIKTTPQAIGALGINFLSGGNIVHAVRTIARGYSSTRYNCFLAGKELLMSSLQLRWSPTRVYAYIVIPNANQYLSDIIANILQTVTVTKTYVYSDGTEDTFVYFAIPLTNYQLNEGGRRVSITLQLNDTYTNANPHTLTLLDSPNYRNVKTDGTVTVRGTVDPRVRPGDTITVGSDTFLVSEVVHYINPFDVIAEYSE